MVAGCFEDEGGVMGVHDFCGVWGENCWVLRVIMPGDDAGDHAQDNSDKPLLLVLLLHRLSLRNASTR